MARNGRHCERYGSSRDVTGVEAADAGHHRRRDLEGYVHANGKQAVAVVYGLVISPLYKDLKVSDLRRPLP